MMLLDDNGREDFQLSLGVTPFDSPLVGSHVGWEEGSIVFRASDGMLSVQDKVPASMRTREQRKIAVGDTVGCGCVFSGADDGDKGSTLITVFWTRNGTVVCSLDLSEYRSQHDQLYPTVAIEGLGSRIVVCHASPAPILELVLAGCYEAEDGQVTQVSNTAAGARSGRF